MERKRGSKQADVNEEEFQTELLKDRTKEEEGKLIREVVPPDQDSCQPGPDMTSAEGEVGLHSRLPGVSGAAAGSSLEGSLSTHGLCLSLHLLEPHHCLPQLQSKFFICGANLDLVQNWSWWWWWGWGLPDVLGEFAAASIINTAVTAGPKGVHHLLTGPPLTAAPNTDQIWKPSSIPSLPPSRPKWPRPPQSW